MVTKGAETDPYGIRHLAFEIRIYHKVHRQAVQRLSNSRITELVVTNTIPLAPEKLIDKVTVLSVAPLLAEAIRRIHQDTSVSELFER